MKDPKDKEESRREFYKQNFNSKFDVHFAITTDEERDEFLEFVKYNNTLRNLTAIHERQSDSARLVCHLKHIFFVGFIFCFPLQSWMPAASCYIAAHVASLIHMYLTLKPKKDGYLPRLFSEEELLNLFTYGAIIITGPALRCLLWIQLLIWAFVSTCEWLEYILEKYPDFPILCALTPLLDTVKDSWIGIIKVKNHLELAAMMISCVGWIFGWNAPLLAVIYTQFVRIKAVSSHYTKNSFSQLNHGLEQILPEGIYLAFINPIAGYIRSMD